MTTYAIPDSHRTALNALLPAYIDFAPEHEADVNVHNTDDASLWGLDLDQLVSDSGVGTDYASYIATQQTLDQLHCKIYRYLDEGDAESRDPLVPPFPYNYNTGLTRRLHPKRIFDHGEMQRVEFYADATPQPNGSVIYDDLVLTEDYVYVRDSVGFAESRTLTITWYREDETPHPNTKLMEKIYPLDERMQEGKRRRGNVVDNLSLTVSGLLLMTELANNGGDQQATLDMGRALLADYAVEIDNFVEASIQTLYTRLLAETNYAWLDNDIGGGTTIRMVMLNEINIWSL